MLPDAGPVPARPGPVSYFSGPGEVPGHDQHKILYNFYFECQNHVFPYFPAISLIFVIFRQKIIKNHQKLIYFDDFSLKIVKNSYILIDFDLFSFIFTYFHLFSLIFT